MQETNVCALIPAIAVVITAIVTWLIAQRRIAVKHVTAERSKWRKAIRKHAPRAHDAILKGKRVDLRRLKSKFRLLLSPLDCQDRRILKCMEVVDEPWRRKKKAKEFDKRVSLLLKHDWERAKLEAGFFLRRWILEAKRQPYRGECKERRLRWQDKYSMRWWTLAPILLLGISAVTFLVDRFWVC